MLQINRLVYLIAEQCPVEGTFGEDMSDTDMSTDSLEDCGVDLQFGDQTLDNLAGSLLACTGKAFRINVTQQTYQRTVILLADSNK